MASSHVGFGRYLHLVRSAHVLLLAPTWIAVNASIGLWFSQSLFQFSKADPKFPEQQLMRGFDANQITIAAIVDRDRLRRRAALLGQPVQEPAADHDHPVRHRRRGGPGRRPAWSSTTPAGWPIVVPLAAAAARRRRAVRAGRRDAGGARAAGRHLGALPGRPRRDHGPLLGVPRDRPDQRAA